MYSELYDVWWPGAPHRTLRNKTFDEWDTAGRPPPGKRPGEGTSIGKSRSVSGDTQAWPRYAVGIVPPNFEGEIERVPLLAGESCSVVNDLKPAAQPVVGGGAQGTKMAGQAGDRPRAPPIARLRAPSSRPGLESSSG